MAYYDSYSQTFQSAGVQIAWQAEWKPNIIPFLNNNLVISISESLEWDEVPCGIDILPQEDRAANSNGSFLYDQQIQLTIPGVFYDLIPQFDGKKYIFFYQDNNQKYWLFGLDTGLRLLDFGSTPSKEGEQTTTTMRFGNNQRHEKYQCSTGFIEEIIFGPLISPENLTVEQE